MRAITAKAARNSRSKTSVSLTLAAVATHATGTPSPSTATLYFVPRLARSVGLGPVRSPPRLARTEQLSRIRSGWPRSMPTSRACTWARTPVSGPPHPSLGRHTRLWASTPVSGPAHPSLGQHTRLGPACEPPPQGRTAGLVPCRAQAAPGRALAQEAPQSRQHPDRVSRRAARSMLSWRPAHLDHGRNQTQDPDVQGYLLCLAYQT